MMNVITEDRVFEVLLQIAPASSADVAEVLGCAERTVRRRFEELRARGEIKVHDRRYVIARTSAAQPPYAALMEERNRLRAEVERLTAALTGRTK